MNMVKLPEDFKIGLTLSGGASYGIAHVGVLKALREFGIEPNVVYGTSAGAIAAVLYGSGASISDMRRFIEGNKMMSMRRLRVSAKGFIPPTYLENRLSEFVPYKYLEELPRKAMIGATNLETGLHNTLETGPISTAVAASCAIPVFFTPIDHQGSLYVDGGVSNNMPARPLQDHCDFIIGCDVVETRPLDRKNFNGFRSILERTLTISLTNRTLFNYPACDYVIRPQGLSRYGKFDLSRTEEFINTGYYQTLIDLPRILENMKLKLRRYMKEKSPYFSPKHDSFSSVPTDRLVQHH